MKSKSVIKYYILGILIYKLEINGNKECVSFIHSFLFVPFYINIKYR